MSQLEKLLQDVRTERNRHLHRGEQVDVGQGAGTSAQYRLLTFVVTSQRLSGDKLLTREETDLLFGFEVRAIVATLQSQIADLVRSLHSFFDVLCPLYERSHCAVESGDA